jgi:hypothetical protein
VFGGNFITVDDVLEAIGHDQSTPSAS